MRLVPEAIEFLVGVGEAIITESLQLGHGGIDRPFLPEGDLEFGAARIVLTAHEHGTPRGHVHGAGEDGMNASPPSFLFLSLSLIMGIEASIHKGLNDHRINVGGREFRAGWPASVALSSGALLYGVRQHLPVPWTRRTRGAAVVMLALVAYAACFREHPT